MTRETYGGFHFWNLYQNCRWKFFLRYAMGLIPEKSSKALLFGGAIHEAKAAWWKTQGDEDICIKAFLDSMAESESKYPEANLYIEDSNRGVPLLRQWCADVGRQDLRDYDIVAVEELLEPKLPNGFQLTVRPDVIFKTKGKNEYLIGETKTTGYSWSATEESLNLSDQVIMYLWGVKKCYPEWNVYAVLPDIMYQKQSKIICKHGDLIFRTRKELRDFEIQTTGILTEISQKMQAVADGFNPVLLFDKNSSWSNSYNAPCEYLGICRKWDLEGVPDGFQQSPWIEREKVLGIDPKKVTNQSDEQLPLDWGEAMSEAISTGAES